MKRYALALLLLLATMSPVWAFDFSATAPTGQTLYFNIVEDGVELTHPVSTSNPNNMWGAYIKPTGTLAIPQTVEHDGTTYNVVGVGSYALYNCYAVSSLTIPEGVTAVGLLAFHGCTDLAEVHLPSTLLTVGNSAFSACDSLREVWIAATVPPEITVSVFSSSPVGEGVLHVPEESVGLYAAATGWNAFGQVVGIGTATLTVRANYADRGTVTGTGTYATGTAVAVTATPAAGCFLACWSDGDTAESRVLTLTHDDTLTAFFFHYQNYDPANAPHDTVTLFVFDTITIFDTLRDTVTLTDTLYPTFYHLTVTSDDNTLGIGVGSAVLAAGTDVEVCALAVEGGRFVVWSDGATQNPRRLTVEGDRTLTAHFERLDAIAVPEAPWQATVVGRRLEVRCGIGERLRLYDMQGRALLSTVTVAETTVLQLPSAGIYLLQVGNGAARKVKCEK